MRPLAFVTGKGGVGKSTVAAALALAAVARGQRVLAISLGEPGGLARIFGVTPRAGEIARTAGVAVTWFDGATALGEYLTRRMRLGRLGRAIIEHPLYAAFVAAAPGLRELLAIGKVRDELVLQRRWDVVIVDAGASGHALEYLGMPAAAARAFGAGLVHREAARNAALLRDHATCAVHVVATPEEMPLREAAQIIERLRALDVGLGSLLVNGCRPVAPDGIDAAIGRLAPPVSDVARRARAWEQIQERGLAAIATDTGVAARRLPRIWTGDGLALAKALAPWVAEPT